MFFGRAPPNNVMFGDFCYHAPPRIAARASTAVFLCLTMPCALPTIDLTTLPCLPRLYWSRFAAFTRCCTALRQPASTYLNAAACLPPAAFTLYYRLTAHASRRRHCDLISSRVDRRREGLYHIYADAVQTVEQTRQRRATVDWRTHYRACWRLRATPPTPLRPLHSASTRMERAGVTVLPCIARAGGEATAFRGMPGGRIQAWGDRHSAAVATNEPVFCL